MCHHWQCCNKSVEGFFLFTESIRFFGGDSLYTQMPVYYVHVAKMNTVSHKIPAINPTFKKILMFLFKRGVDCSFMVISEDVVCVVELFVLY